MMNKTVIGHTVLAITFQMIIGLLTDNWWAGAAFGSAVFIGREHAQAEYRYIKANGGKRYHTPLPPEIGCLRMEYWDKGSMLDWIAPVVGTLVVALLNY